MVRTLIATALLAAVTVVGCGDGRRPRRGGMPVDTRPFVTATAQGLAPATALAMLAALNRMDPANHPPLEAGVPPAVTATGDDASGTVTLDFASGTVVADAVYRGKIVVTYVRESLGEGAGAGSATVDLSDLDFATDTNGAVDVEGAVALDDLSWGTTSANAGGASALVLRMDGAEHEVATSGYSWTFDAEGVERVLMTEGAVWDPRSANARIELLGLAMTFVGANRALVAGDIVAVQDRFAFFYRFDAPNSGTVIAAPSPNRQPFSF